MKSPIYFVKTSIFLAFIGFILTTQACKPRLIPSTNVSASRENQRIVKFLEQYKTAIEKRSVDGIMELVAKDFKDGMGSDDPSLYMDYLGLKEKLEKFFPRIQDIRLAMFVQHIAKIDKDTYEAVFYFNKHVLAEVPSGEKWISIKEVNRMIMRRRYDKETPYQYEILQGI